MFWAGSYCYCVVDFASEIGYLNWLIVNTCSRFRIDGFDPDELVVAAHGEVEGKFVVACFDWFYRDSLGVVGLSESQ